MKCPTCTDTAQVMTDRQGVEIDKLIDRAGPTASAPPAYAPPPARRPDFVDSDYGHHGHQSSGGYPANRRKKSWLSDIFD